MKSINSAIQTKLDRGVTTWALCWRVALKLGFDLGFTAHSQSIRVGDMTYNSVAGVTESAMKSNSSLAVDNVDFSGVLAETGIEEVQIAAGLFDGSEVYFFLVDWTDPEAGTIPMKSGVVGEINIQDTAVNVEFRSLSQYLNQNYDSQYSPTCRATLGSQIGDEKWWCGVNRATYTELGAVETVLGRDRFIDTSLGQTDAYFDYGNLIWTSGENEGLSMEVRKYTASTGRIDLFMGMGYDIQPGDTYAITAGCDKRFKTCRVKFNNAINFKGEPHVPGDQAVYEYGKQPQS